jgi:CRP/FNR family transcriptional regulator
MMNVALATLFRRYGSPVALGRGSTCFVEKEPCRQVALLDEGCVRIFRSRPGDREGTLYRVQPGELCLVSSLAALSEQPLLASAAADEAATGWALPAAAFRKLFAQDEFLRTTFLGVLARRLRALIELLEDTQDLSVDDRLASYLLDRARVGPGTAGAGRLDMTHEKIAADLWTAREVVSRALKGLEQRGCVRLERGSIVVVDPDRLAGVSSRLEG